MANFPFLTTQAKILGHVTVGISQEESANVLHNLRVTLWLAFPLLLLVLFRATSVAAARGILPVHRLIKTVAEISESNFHVRLPLPEHRDEIFQLASTINDLLD